MYFLSPHCSIWLAGRSNCDNGKKIGGRKDLVAFGLNERFCELKFFEAINEVFFNNCTFDAAFGNRSLYSIAQRCWGVQNKKSCRELFHVVFLRGGYEKLLTARRKRTKVSVALSNYFLIRNYSRITLIWSISLTHIPSNQFIFHLTTINLTWLGS